MYKINITNHIENIKYESVRLRIRFIFNKINEYKNETLRRFFYSKLVNIIASLKNKKEDFACDKLDLWFTDICPELWGLDALEEYTNL